MIDEAHERHVSTDLLLGMLRALLPRRPELRLVVMSATLNASLFAAMFEGAPMITVPGRTFPVETVWLGVAPAASAPRAAGEAGGSRRMNASRANELLHPDAYLRVNARATT